MSSYLGPIGGMVPFEYYKGGLDVSADRPVKSIRTLGGRVKVQRGPLSRRTWSVSLDHLNPAELSALTALEMGGTPPFVFVEPMARVTNLFSPEQSVLMPGTFSGAGVVAGGSVNVGGVMAPRSVLHASGGTVDFGYRDGVADRPVVVPGVPVTVSAYVRGTGLLGVSWRDWSGAVISESTAAYSNATLARSSMVNLVPPANAATVRFWATGMLQAAMPALSWTPAVQSWAVGRGCNRVILEGLSEGINRVIYAAPDQSRSSLSFTVREVG